MKRAYLIELTIFRDYARQLIGLGIIVSLCIGFGMQTPLAMARNAHLHVLHDGFDGSCRL